MGAYATVLEVEYDGQKYAGKKTYGFLIDDVMNVASIDRFMDECRLLSQLDHPNVVQFVGVYFHEGERVPILVMELLPTNLNACIRQYGILPKDICYSILHDVALGLHYLHSQSPPIMHRDIDACNILLTSNMSAKICDFGSARSLATNDIGLTRTPGGVVYMPPEALVHDPRYDTSIDVFSYGIVMVSMFSGKLPEDLKAPTYLGRDGLFYARTEVERREQYLQAIGNDHPAMKLILQCISNDPQQRPTATKISQEIKRICQYDGKCSIIDIIVLSCNHY
jgi:serine/threonine protein kinase